MRIPDKLRPSLAGILAAILAAGVIYLIRWWWKEPLDITFLLGLFGTIFTFLQKFFASWFNPTDAASPDIAAVATAPKGQGSRSALAEGLHQLAGTLDTEATKPNEPGQA